MDKYLKYFKEKESDKINKELLNGIYPMEGLENYYWFGFASALSELDKLLNTYNDSFTRKDFKYILEHYSKAHEKVNEYFNRLQKDKQ